MTLPDRLLQYDLLDTDGQKIHKDEKNSFLGFVNALYRFHGKHIIYRGESKSNLKHLFRDCYVEDDLLPCFIFMLGDKSKACWQHSYPQLITSETTLDNFKLILNKVREVLVKREDRTAIQTFKERNQSYVDKVINNEKGIVDSYEQLMDYERELVNLFYLTLLHTIDAKGYGHISTFVSTSERFDTAERFAHDYIFFGWRPKYGIFAHTGSRVINECRKNEFKGIPLCGPAYEKQEEISLRCGLLPHFMLGFLVKGTNSFYVNPAIGTIINESSNMEDLVGDGLNVDQSYFKDFCQHSNLSYYFTVCDGHYELHKLEF